MSLHLDDDYDEPVPRHTELTLSAGVILGGIVGLILLCGLFFGLGYSMHHVGPVALPVATGTDAAAPAANFNNFKPAAGSPLHPDTTSAPATITPVASKPIPAPPVVAPVVTKPVAVASTPVAATAPTPASGGFYVQIAAVTQQPDAQRLSDTLHAKGYLVTTRTESQDKLFHVQIGPYASHKDADLIRQKLVGEGYSPIVK